MNKNTQVKDIPAVEVVNALINLNCELQGALLELMIGYDSGSFLEYEEKQLKELRSIGERFA